MPPILSVSAVAAQAGYRDNAPARKPHIGMPAVARTVRPPPAVAAFPRVATGAVASGTTLQALRVPWRRALLRAPEAATNPAVGFGRVIVDGRTEAAYLSCGHLRGALNGRADESAAYYCRCLSQSC